MQITAPNIARSAMFNDTLVLAVDIDEYEDRYIIMVDIPGITNREVKASVSNDELTIITNKSNEPNDTGGKILYRERKAYQMTRKVHLDNCVDAENLAVYIHNGVLTLTVHKSNRKRQERHIEGVWA